MKDEKLNKLTEKQGVITCLSEAEKQRLQTKGFTVLEIQTPCGAYGNQAVTRPNKTQ